MYKNTCYKNLIRMIFAFGLVEVSLMKLFIQGIGNVFQKSLPFLTRFKVYIVDVVNDGRWTNCRSYQSYDSILYRKIYQ